MSDWGIDAEVVGSQGSLETSQDICILTPGFLSGECNNWREMLFRKYTLQKFCVMFYLSFAFNYPIPIIIFLHLE